MKEHMPFTPGFGLLLLLCPNVIAQPLPHHFSGLARAPDGIVTLSLDGSESNLIPGLTGTISNQFMQMFDIYLVEASTNLADWTRLATLLRTNNDPTPLLFQDADATNFSRRFYRLATNHLITMFPKPSGPFAVGTLDRVMVDPARTNLYRYTPKTNAFMVTFWYPAEAPGAGVLPRAMWDKQVAEDTSMYTANGYDGRWSKIFPQAVGHRFTQAPLAAVQSRFPVVLHSHGLPFLRFGSSQMAEDLASHGYVVVAPDHPDCWTSEFPDGRYLRGNWGGDNAGRFKDFEFLLAELARLDADDPFFAGRLDLDRVGIMGVSYGGMSAEMCRRDDRLQAVALLDATNFQLPSTGLAKPFLAMNAPGSSFLAESQALFNKAMTNATWLQISGAIHPTFCDIAWSAHIPWGRAPALAINACLVWFFDTYLKGEAPPFPANPEIVNVRRK
ncbi:MAG: hypothetical protein FJ387_26570 [Verrucomicrobia bacterium]|nr:hypothetical protein [Verrucomicrobiota bacterium]